MDFISPYNKLALSIKFPKEKQSFNLSISRPPQQRPVNQTCRKRNFAKADWSSMCDFLVSINWHAAFSGCITAEQNWEVIRSFVEEAVDKCVPFFKQSKHVSPVALYPRHIRKLRDTKRARWKLYHKFHTPELKAKYKRAAKRFSQAVNDLAVQKENGLCDTANLGSLYKYVNKKLNSSNNIAPLKDPRGTLTSDEYDKAGILNNYLSSVFMHDNGIFEEKWPIPVKASTMNPVFIAPVMVQKVVCHFAG